MSNITTDYMGYTVIATGEDANRYATPEVAAQAYAEELYRYISDASKDAQGWRLRLDITNMTFSALEEECRYWDDQVSASIDYEKREAAQAVENFKALVQRTIELGAEDEETALRWLVQDEQDVEHWVYMQGILFTDYGRDLVSRLIGD
jgi:hypothetical protein